MARVLGGSIGLAALAGRAARKTRGKVPRKKSTEKVRDMSLSGERREDHAFRATSLSCSNKEANEMVFEGTLRFRGFAHPPCVAEPVLALRGKVHIENLVAGRPEKLG